MSETQIGLIGLGVMGENLALNIERNGFPIAIYNRHYDKVANFVNGRGKGKKVFGFEKPEDFVKSIKRPRRIILLVPAGDAVDSTISAIKPYLDKGDIIIDAGNSNFHDTIRREADLAKEGFYLIGSGVSGGEEGALNGPSLMPGGNKAAYDELKPVWEAAAAKVSDGPCVTYIGPDGAGHFVKMVHNGIEYGDMQLIAETYDIMRKVLNMSAGEIASTFSEWNKGYLDSYLIEITAKVLACTDSKTGKPMVDMILDKAGQKGTGKWTVESAADLFVAIPTIDAALTARLLSSLKEQREKASSLLPGPEKAPSVTDKAAFLDALAQALYVSKVCSYAQGMALIKAGSDKYSWNVNLAEMARIWKGGCIIRAKLLDEIQHAFTKEPDLVNLLISKHFKDFFVRAQSAWRTVIVSAINHGIPTPAFSASLAYYDSYRTEKLPQNLTQAQRDFFGAHTYQRVDDPNGPFIHTEWNELLKVKTR